MMQPGWKRPLSQAEWLQRKQAGHRLAQRRGWIGNRAWGLSLKNRRGGNTLANHNPIHFVKMNQKRWHGTYGLPDR